MDASLLSFLGISAVVIMTPGPDTALTIRNTLLGGRRGGLGTAVGVATGQLVWALATSLGVVALLLASEPLFRTLKLLGAAYLIYLGGQALHAAWRGRAAEDCGTGEGGRARPRGCAAFRQGVLNNLANPKMAIFFASVLPQFAPPGPSMWASLVLLGGVFAGLTLLWLALYAVLLAAAGDVFRSSRVGRAVDAGAGVVLVGLGLKVAAEDL